jgi:hypothetical protein
MGAVTIKQTKKKSNNKEKQSKLEKKNPFKTMEIMANCSSFIYMNVKEFKPKIHLIKF